MNADEVGWFEWVFKAGCSAFAIVFSWIGNNMVQAIKSLQKENSFLKDLIKSHELEDSRLYVSKQDFKETVVEMKDTVKRSHERLDDMASDISDIKTLIVNTINTHK